MRQLFRQFPSVKKLHVKFAGFGPHAIVSSGIEPASLVRITGLRLQYNRPRNRFALFVDLSVRTWHELDDDLDEFKFASETGSEDGGSQDTVIKWSGQSTFYRSVVQLVKRRDRFITSIEAFGPVPPPSIFELIEALGFDPANLPARVRTINAPSTVVFDLDENRPQWHKLKRISIVDPELDPEYRFESAEIVNATDLRRFAGIVARSPRFREIDLAGAVCPSTQWHPLVFLLRAIAEQTQAPSSIENIVVYVDEDWENNDPICPTLQVQTELDLRGRFPHLESVYFTWPNALDAEEDSEVGDSGEESEITGPDRAAGIANLLTAASAGQARYDFYEDGWPVEWEVCRVWIADTA